MKITSMREVDGFNSIGSRFTVILYLSQAKVSFTMMSLITMNLDMNEFELSTMMH